MASPLDKFELACRLDNTKETSKNTPKHIRVY